MLKLRTFICSGITIVFFLLQLLLLQNFDIMNVANTALYENIVYLQQTCSKYAIQCILVDGDILKAFVDNEMAHRSQHSHDHKVCQLFCNGEYSRAVFLVKGEHFNPHKDMFIDDLKKAGFTTLIDVGKDIRQMTLERRHVNDKLLSHIFIEKNDVLIHVIMTYEILNHEWSNSCQKSVRHIPKENIFCDRQNLYRDLETTNAMIDGIDIFIPQYVGQFVESLPTFQFKQCNFAQARTYFSTYGYDAAPESELFRQKAKNILRVVSRTLDEIQVPFWLSSGTCLGYIRQCDVIPHSKDVDIGIFIKDYKPRLISDLRNAGFILKHQFGKRSDSFELSFVMDDLKLDIFFFYEELDYMWNGGTQVRSGKKFKYIFKKFNLCWTVFLDMPVRVPCQIEDYILANYGSSWKIPVKTWDWKSSPPNVRDNGEWPPEERVEVIQTFL